MTTRNPLPHAETRIRKNGARKSPWEIFAASLLRGSLPFSSAILPALALNLTWRLPPNLPKNLINWLPIGIQTGVRKPTAIRWNSKGSQMAFRYP